MDAREDFRAIARVCHVIIKIRGPPCEPSVLYIIFHLTFSQHLSINQGKLAYTKAGFLSLSTTDILGQIILCGGGCAVHSRMLSSIYALHANSTFPSCDNQKTPPDITKCLRVGSATSPQFEDQYAKVSNSDHILMA